MPLKLNAVAPGGKVLGVVPAHVPPTALIFVSVSVNDALVNAPVVLGFESVSVMVV